MPVQFLSVIVPAYNEERSIASALEAIFAGLKNLPQSEVIVVDDGSRDATPQILRRAQEQFPQLKVLRHEKNRMIGGAFLSGLNAATGSHIILIPVDNPLSSDTLQRYIAAAQNADVVVGVRPARAGYKAWMAALSKVYWLFCVALFGAKISDFTWISLYDREKIKKLSLRFEGIAIFPEILVKAKKRGLKLVEISCAMAPRKSGRATVSRISRILHLLTETFRLWRHLTLDRW